MAQRTLYRRLHYVLCIDVRPRQHGRKATQPRQQLYQLAPELRHVFNQPLTDNDSARGLFPPASSFCSVQFMGRPGQAFRKTAVLAAFVLFAVPSWSHDENERREVRAERESRDDRLEREIRTDNSGPGSRESENSGSGSSESGDRSDDRHDRDDRGRGSSARFEVERDTAGRERVRREVLMVADKASIDAVRNAGFTIIAERPLTAFGETLVRIRVRRGRSVEQVISELQALAPLASIAPHHLFRPSADELPTTAAETAEAPVPEINAGHVGVIDTGADVSWPALTHSIVQTEAFADGGYMSRTHGTLVSEIIARSGARLSVADVFGVDGDNRLIAPAAAIASAIDWMVANGVRVMNISIEGPDNFVLAHVIKRALAADVAIVAAAGNGGPAAAPAFPAAYPGASSQSLQSTRTDRSIDAPIVATTSPSRRAAYTSSRSTSRSRPKPRLFPARRSLRRSSRQQSLAGSKDPRGVGGVIDSLKSEARDLGVPGRDAIYGWGELAIPKALTASSRQ